MAARTKAQSPPTAKGERPGEAAAPARTISAAHKAALAHGREQGHAVRRYLEALEKVRPKRGRKRTVEVVRRQLADVEARIDGAAPLERVHLIQERLDLVAELELKEATVDLAALEADFVRAAREYGERKGISHAAWKEAGVPPAVLKRAGITP